jgi:signal transduction histidine kinase/class 3 adenylate cyclase/CheY-like chemotaxis protein
LQKSVFHKARHWIASLALGVCLWLTADAAYSNSAPAAVQKGVVDFAGWNFEQANADLSGEWHYLQGIWVTERLTDLPMLLKDAPKQRVPNPLRHELTSPGYGSYILEVHNLAGSDGRIGLLTANIFESFELYLVPKPASSSASPLEAIRLLQSGEINKVPNQGRPHVRVQQSSLRLVHGDFWIVVQISFSGKEYSGIQLPPQLGYMESLIEDPTFSTNILLAMLVMNFAVGFYHLGLFAIRKNDLASFWFGSFCLNWAIWILTLSHTTFSLHSWFVDSMLAYSWVRRLEYMSVFSAHTLFFNYYCQVFPAEWRQSYKRFLNLTSLVGVVVIAFTDFDVYSRLLPFFHVLYVVSMVVVLVTSVQAVRNKLPNAWITLLGLLGFFFCVGYFLVGSYAKNLPFLMEVFASGFVTFLAMQSLMIMKIFAAAHDKAAYLSAYLSQEVSHKTQELQRQTEEAIRLKDQAFESKEQLEAANQQLRVLDQQKTQFFQNISHELRTPLTLIINPLELVLQQYPDELNLKVVMKNAMRLLRLVNQLLDFQKLKAGKLDLKPVPIHLHDFLSSASQFFEPTCQRKQIDFAFEDRSTQPLYVLAHVDGLEKIIFNYLSNAMKYTPLHGRIRLVLERQGGRAVIAVADSGIGIDEAGLKKLFQQFSQIDDSSSRHYEGSGLGLALVKELTEVMGGQVGVKSEPGRGSTFWVEFPLYHPDEMQISSQLSRFSEHKYGRKDWLLADGGDSVFEGQSELNKAASALEGPMVLVVDDITDMRHMIATMLRQRGFRVSQAKDGREALGMCLSSPPDLIITDWMMPEMTGPQLVEAIHGNKELAAIPIILLTAKSDDESRRSGIQIGANAYIGKPFDSLELISTVDNLLSLKKKEQEVVALNRNLTENVLGRFLPEQLVQDIVLGKVNLNDRPEQRLVTILSSDICGFTQAAETLGAAPIALMLNDYLSRMSEVVFAHGGMVDKFIGDGIMVMFGVPMEMPAAEQVQRAADTAFAMQHLLHELNAKWLSQGLVSFEMRIGIHHGTAIVGSFGSARRSEYTAIGPVVNTAFRIESVTQPGEIYISPAVAEFLASDSYEYTDEFLLKGIQSSIVLYRLKKQQVLDKAS